MTDELLTLGQVAREAGCPEWKLRQLYREGLLAEPARVGCSRAILRRDVPRIKAALRRRWPAAAAAAACA